jgi:hypothetical protein
MSRYHPVIEAASVMGAIVVAAVMLITAEDIDQVFSFLAATAAYSAGATRVAATVVSFARPARVPPSARQGDGPPGARRPVAP